MSINFGSNQLFSAASTNAFGMGMQHWGSSMSSVSSQMQQMKGFSQQNSFSTGSSMQGMQAQTSFASMGGFLQAPGKGSMSFAQSMTSTPQMGQQVQSAENSMKSMTSKLGGMVKELFSSIMKLMSTLMEALKNQKGMKGSMDRKAGTSIPNSQAQTSTPLPGSDKPSGGKSPTVKPKPTRTRRPRPRVRPRGGRDESENVSRGGLSSKEARIRMARQNIEMNGGDGGDGGGNGGDGGDPLAFDLNGDGRIGVTGTSTAEVRKGQHTRGRTVQFDLDGDGKKDTTEWMAGGGDGLLVDNSDGKAAADMNGKRLFGDEGGTYRDGIAKLAQRDKNNDGKLTGDELKGLEMWVDNGDAKVQKGEMKTLDELGINEISVKRDVVTNKRGEKLMRSSAKTKDGKSIMTEDVWFSGDFSKKKS